MFQEKQSAILHSEIRCHFPGAPILPGTCMPLPNQCTTLPIQLRQESLTSPKRRSIWDLFADTCRTHQTPACTILLRSLKWWTIKYKWTGAMRREKWTPYLQCLVISARPSVLKPMQLVRDKDRKLEKDWAIFAKLASFTIMRFRRSSCRQG